MKAPRILHCPDPADVWAAVRKKMPDETVLLYFTWDRDPNTRIKSAWITQSLLVGIRASAPLTIGEPQIVNRNIVRAVCKGGVRSVLNQIVCVVRFEDGRLSTRKALLWVYDATSTAMPAEVSRDWATGTR